MKFVITGSIAFDYLMTFPGYFKDHILPEHLDSISLSFLVDSMVRQKGGVGPNISYTLALLGEEPLLVGTVGEDFEEYRRWLNEANVNTNYVKVIKGEYSASFFANTDQANSQIASFYTGAMAHSDELSIKDLTAEKPDLVLVSPNDPAAMAKYVQECQELGINYLYDPGQQLARISAEDMKQGVSQAHSLFVNDYEFELLQKHTGMSVEEIISNIKLVVVTRGKDGASIYTEGQEYKVDVVKPEAILDPTGVGDAFRGGFLKGYSQGFDWVTCGQMGALAATYCLEQKGTQNHSYTVNDFIDRYRKNFDDKGKLDALLS